MGNKFFFFFLGGGGSHVSLWSTSELQFIVCKKVRGSISSSMHIHERYWIIDADESVTCTDTK